MSKKHILLLGAVLVMAASCSQKKEDTVHTSAVEEHQPQRHVMEVYHLQDTIEGTNFTYTLHREADDSLRTVADEYGDEYVDNHYDLYIQRGGNLFYKNRFTKATFAPMLDDGFRANAIFDGFRFNRYEEGKLYFSVCVSYPDSDLSQPFILTIDPDGSHTITPDNVMDMDEEYDEDGV